MTSAQNTEQRRELDRAEWFSYFNNLSRELAHGLDLEAAIEVTSEAVDGTEAEALPLNGISYEKKDDQVAISLGGRRPRFPAILTHFVDHPTLVWVREEGGIPVAIGIESGDPDRTYTFIRLQRAGGPS
jgi:hypothetical protein